MLFPLPGRLHSHHVKALVQYVSYMCELLLQPSQQWQLRPGLQARHSLGLQPSTLCRL